MLAFNETGLTLATTNTKCGAHGNMISSSVRCHCGLLDICGLCCERHTKTMLYRGNLSSSDKQWPSRLLEFAGHRMIRPFGDSGASRKYARVSQKANPNRNQPLYR